jgi:23S rRNA (cytidine1920-2'-O)/16S rRNA (cytidine1409-2'-O)-methyltransferase
MAQAKERLDKLLVDRGIAESRAKAQAYIMAGEVSVNGLRVDKPGTAVALNAVIELATPMPYVSRGGYKLAGALDEFGLNVAGLICADVGACTGGFTDVLLQRGATRVYAIDVGQGQLDWKLRQDSRVVVMERTNARYLESLPDLIDFVTVDVSFISLKLILPVVARWLGPDGRVLALIKPQFEAGPESVGKGGIVRDAKVRRQVLTNLLSWANENGWLVGGLTRSSIKGADGNIEYLVFLLRGRSQPTKLSTIIDSVSDE